MFGHQDDQSAPQDGTQIPDQSIDSVISGEVPAAEPAVSTDWQHPGTPLDDSAATPVVSDTPVVDAPATDAPTIETPAPADSIETVSPEPAAETIPEINPAPEVTEATASPVSDDVDTNSLIDIKQQALGQLSPLVDHLDQTPEEKFRTTMMMIQASDNQSLLRSAYDTATQITDEKVRAQALLDIINEINYFTQHQTPAV